MSKILSAWLVGLVLVGCDTGPNRFDPSSANDEIEFDDCSQDDRMLELEAQLEEARAQLEVLISQKQELQSAAEELQSNVDRLSYENWRDVVPDIDNSADYVELQSQEMDSAISEAEAILDER